MGLQWLVVAISGLVTSNKTRLFCIHTGFVKLSNNWLYISSYFILWTISQNLYLLMNVCLLELMQWYWPHECMSCCQWPSYTFLLKHLQQSSSRWPKWLTTLYMLYSQSLYNLNGYLILPSSQVHWCTTMFYSSVNLGLSVSHPIKWMFKITWKPYSQSKPLQTVNWKDNMKAWSVDNIQGLELVSACITGYCHDVNHPSSVEFLRWTLPIIWH